MPRTNQIVPKYSFPHIEVYMNDYTLVQDDDTTATEESTINYLYPVVTSAGIDNVFVKLTSKDVAKKRYGNLDFAKHGQPYAQALENLGHANSAVWLMRVMPDDAAYSNALMSAYYKADTAADYPDAHLRKFRIKFTRKTETGLLTVDDVKNALNTLDGTPTGGVYVDAEGYTQVPFLGVYTAGRGKYGDIKSIRLSQNVNYEKNYGIKIYNYEILDNSNGLILDANYIAALVTSNKYSELTPTLIDDVLSTYAKGSYPVEVFSLEDNIDIVYNAYIKFAKDLNTDLVTELANKLAEYNIPQDVLDGITPPATPQQAEQLLEVNTIKAMISNTKDEALPDRDEFDLIYGRKVASTEMLPGIYYTKELTSDVDITDPDYDANDYTTTAIVDFSDVSGIGLENGSDGAFETPRLGKTVQDEINECYIKAYNGEYDKRVLSPNRLAVTAFWDAGYDFSVKQVLAQLVEARNDCRVFFDVGIINSLSEAVVNNLITKYAGFNSFSQSIDVHHYDIRDEYSKKKVTVTISYFLSGLYIDHIVRYGIHVPFVKERCTLSGHVKDSLGPVVEEWETDVMEKLNDNRFNYFTCIDENVFRRAIQNTRQVEVSDLLEENNAAIYYELKRSLTRDADSQIYNFADERLRQEFIEVEKAKYASWVGTRLESFDISFAESEYEFNHKILHLYASVVFRGLTKIVLIEIDINKRTYTGYEASES